MHLRTGLKRIFIAGCALMLLTGSALAADAGFVRSTGTRVYENSDLSGRSASIKRYTLVEIISVENGIAKIKANGYTVYLPSAQLEIFDGTVQEMEFAKAGRAYEYPSTSSRSVKMAKGSKVNVLYTANGVAVIEKDGAMAYVSESALEKPIQIIYEEYEVVVTADTLKAYKSPSTSSKVLGTLKKGDVALLTARTDEWALISVNGVQGRVKLSGIQKYKMTMAEIFASEKFTNEEKIYYFLVNEMDYSPAAACGVLANVKYESGFRTDAWNPEGSYGICQWHAGRYSRLQNWCAEQGLDYTTLEGQCRYLQYELEKLYPKVNSFMLSVENTADGAYEAGYYFCYNFEVPANRGTVSVTRGTYAQNTYWPKYYNK